MAGGQGGGKGEDGPARRAVRGPRPDLCRRYARKELARGLPGILERFISEAQKGSIPHAKALMSLAGLDREEAMPAAHSKRPKGLSDLLLRELRRRPGNGPAAPDGGVRSEVKRDVGPRRRQDEGSSGDSRDGGSARGAAGE